MNDTSVFSIFLPWVGTNDFTKSKIHQHVPKFTRKSISSMIFFWWKKNIKIPRFPSEPRTVSAPTRSRPKAEKAAYSARVSPDLGCSGCSPLKGLRNQQQRTAGDRKASNHRDFTGISASKNPWKIPENSPWKIAKLHQAVYQNIVFDVVVSSINQR